MDWSSIVFLIVPATLIAIMLATLVVLALKGIGRNFKRDGTHRDDLQP